MFTQYFGLKFNPFGKEVDINNLYESSDITELTARLKYLQNSRGIGLIVGESGAGKSTTIRRYINTLNQGLYKPCYFPLSTLTVKEFYQALATILGETPSSKKVSLFNQIQSAISSYYYEQRVTPVIILDEIQMVSNDILEEIRLIFNFKIDSENPFVLILAGQPHIKNKLTLNIHSALRQRITLKYTLQGLRQDEVCEYLKSRLKTAGLTDNIFTPAAVDAIYSITKGMPRPVNNIATAALMYAYSKNQREINEEVVYQAQNEINI